MISLYAYIEKDSHNRTEFISWTHIIRSRSIFAVGLNQIHDLSSVLGKMVTSWHKSKSDPNLVGCNIFMRKTTRETLYSHIHGPSFFLTRKFGHVGLLFCRNLLIAPYEFTMEKIMFIVRLLKKRLVINLESLLLQETKTFENKYWTGKKKGKT